MRRLTTEEKNQKGTLRPSRETPVALRPLESPPDPPDHLDERGAAAYSAIAGLLIDAGRMTASDCYAVESAAAAYADWREAVDQLRVKGLLTETGHRASPLVGIRNESDRRFRAWCQSLGFTPADRDKITTLAPVEEENPWGDLLNPPDRPDL
jgi:P27 family predicted phage terminase small subunit